MNMAIKLFVKVSQKATNCFFIDIDTYKDRPVKRRVVFSLKHDEQAVGLPQKWCASSFYLYLRCSKP